MMSEGRTFWRWSERRLSVTVLTLFSSWMLAFLFEGRIFYTLISMYDVEPYRMTMGAIAIQAAGLFVWGYVIRSRATARRLILLSIALCFFASVVFFFPPGIMWATALIFSAFMISAAVAGWGYYFQSGTQKNKRLKTAADALIYSNALMILLNVIAVFLSAFAGLACAMFMLAAAFFLALFLPAEEMTSALPPRRKATVAGFNKPLVFLCLFIIVITINSGLMYQVVTPAFAHLERLSGWYWALPYLVAIYIMKNLPRKINRTYILYVAIAMLGISYVAFMVLNRSVMEYLLVNTLMLAAFGVYDLFWWSILGEMLEMGNPAFIFGTGLAANVLGVLTGAVVGNVIAANGGSPHDFSALALVVVCLSLAILPVLHKMLSGVLVNHEYLSALSGFSHPTDFQLLSARENQVVGLLLQGKTYKAIAEELFISDNTVKTHIKNIYSKLNIQSRAELIALIVEKGSGKPPV